MIKFIAAFFNKKSFSLYPILTGILFIFNELRNNGKYYTIKENLSLITIILAFCFLIDILSKKLIKNRIKAALISTLFIVINLFYLDLYNWITAPVFLNKLLSHMTSDHPEVIIIPLLGILGLSFLYFVMNYKSDLLRLNQYLNTILIAFVAVEIIKWFLLPQYDITLAEKVKIPNCNFIQRQGKPNIYYIILDEYTSSESLKKYLKYDNSPFDDSLKRMGFYLAPKSTSDYTSTQHCLSSYLNLSLLKIDSTKKYNSQNLLCIIRNSILEKGLVNQGYNFINYSLFDVGEESHFYNVFTGEHFLGRTIWFTNSFKLWHSLFQSSHISNTNLNIFKMLQNLSLTNPVRPYFVYAHFLMPHAPFIFDENGKRMGKAEQYLHINIKYIKQLRFENTLVINTIRQILDHEKKRPIIIIQGDHGFRFLEGVSIAEKIKESHTILNAYLVPDEIKNELNDSIKPIDGLKLIFQ